MLFRSWATKLRILSRLVALSWPLLTVLTIPRLVMKGGGWRQARASTEGWWRQRLLDGGLAKDRRSTIGQWLLSRWRRQWRPDVLHIQGYTTNLLFAIEWANQRRVPVVYEEHQTPDPQFDWWKGFASTINKATVVVAEIGRAHV